MAAEKPRFAMPDGSYPISSCADVSDAAKLAHHSKTYSFEEIRAHVMKAKAALGCGDSVLPATWEEPDSGRSNADFVLFSEAALSRAILPGPEFRTAENGNTLVGTLAPYDEWGEINSPVEGHYLERYSRTAIQKTLRDGLGKLRILYQHGQDPQIGLKPLGTLERLEMGQRAPEYEVSLFDVDYVNQLKPALETGQLGTSWTFFPVRNKFTIEPKPQRSSYNPHGLPEVTHHEIQMTEFGPCMFQVFNGATAGIRSATDYFLVQRMARDPEYLQQLLTATSNAHIVTAETALSNERAEGEPHSGAESRNVPLVPVRKRFHTEAGWLAWCESALK